MTIGTRRKANDRNEEIIIMPRAAKPTLAGRPKPAPRPQVKKQA